MYRRTDPQGSLFEAGNLLPEAKRLVCQRSWAGPFREKVWAMLLRHEDQFAELYHPEEGRPNRSVALLVGVHLLKEQNDLTDQELLDALDCDIRWWYVFGLETEEAHLCQKTLHNFRVGLMEHERAGWCFGR